MSNGFQWTDEEDTFRDVPDEVADQAPGAQPQPQMQFQPPAAGMTREQIIAQAAAQVPVQEVAHEYQEQLEEDEDYSEVLSDARLRLEQGRLYELVMNSDLFSGADADERAVKQVQRQIKKFAKEQMEIMLGMRQAEIAQNYAEFNAKLANPFNELEVMLLKSLASKMSGGKTEEEQPEQYVAPAAPAPKKAAIKPISVGKQNTTKPLAKQASKPIQRKANQKPTPEELLGLPPEPEKPIGKPLHQMTEQEKVERNQRIAERQRQNKAARPANALPMPSEHQEEMLATARAREADSKGTVSTIMALLDASKR